MPQALDEVISPHNASARLALTTVCSGPATDQQLFYREWLMWMTEKGGCNTTISAYTPHVFDPSRLNRRVRSFG